MEHDTRHPSLAAWCAGIIFFAPIAYFLSLGPAVLVANRFEALESPLEIYVAPAELIYNVSPQPVKTSLDWYIELWWDR
jgi:hypothetical protein